LDATWSDARPCLANVAAMTFSVAAWNPNASGRAEWGVAVASKFLAAGSVVPWARAGAGAIATQALANVAYGPDGLKLLDRGIPAHEVIDTLTATDEGYDRRQVGVIDRSGLAATFTGSQCLDWAGGRTGPGFACQGNILAGPRVLDAMVEAFEASEADLATRLSDALLAGDRAGGDRRGRQSAGILVVREGGGYLGDSDVAVDLRVDDHTDPVPELQRLLSLHNLLFPEASELVFVDMDEAMVVEIRASLADLGYDAGLGVAYDDSLKKALFGFVGTENLEARWTDAPAVEKGVLDSLRTISERL
jgi:uncharacterized Ntn-hydrolase superfamily protein